MQTLKDLFCNNQMGFLVVFYFRDIDIFSNC